MSTVYPPARRRPRAALRFFSCSSEAGFLEAIAYHVTSFFHPGMRIDMIIITQIFKFAKWRRTDSEIIKKKPALRRLFGYDMMGKKILILLKGIDGR